MNLSGLNKYRRQIEDMLRAELSELEGMLEAAAASSHQARTQVDVAVDRWQAALKQGVQGGEVADGFRDIQSLTEAAAQAAARMTDATERWEYKRAEVIEAARERKTLDFLEQRRVHQRMMRLRRLEQQMLDEAAHIRFLRSERAGASHES